MYRALRTRTSDQLDGAVSWFSHLAVRLRLQNAVTCPRCKRDVTWSPQYHQLCLCPACNHHFAIPARQRVNALVDRDSFSPLTRARESVIAGTARIMDQPVVLIAFDFQYHGGTMSIRAGEMVVQAFEHAAGEKMPVVALIASGGVRIQEGLAALLRMASTTQAVLEFQRSRRPFVAVLTNPTTGGVYASFASLADVLLAEPGALIGFAGPRVAEAATGVELPPDSHRAEFALGNGMIDAIVPRGELRETLGRVLSLTAPVSMKANAPESPDLVLTRTGRGTTTPSEILALARQRGRPTACDYIPLLFSDFVELRGDRVERDDDKIRGGIAKFGDQPLMLIAQTRERGAEHELGAAAAGYRKAERLIQMAGRLGLPIITLVDTPGANPGYESERRGVAGAIAHALAALLQTPVPTISFIFGEGTSGGALALAAADRVLMLENAIYAVISPEGASAILFGDGSRAGDAAKRLQMTADELLAEGIIDYIVPEPEGGAHTNAQAASQNIASALRSSLAELGGLSDGERLEARRSRYRRPGH